MVIIDKIDLLIDTLKFGLPGEDLITITAAMTKENGTKEK